MDGGAIGVFGLQLLAAGFGERVTDMLMLAMAGRYEGNGMAYEV